MLLGKGGLEEMGVDYKAMDLCQMKRHWQKMTLDWSSPREMRGRMLDTKRGGSQVTRNLYCKEFSSLTVKIPDTQHLKSSASQDECETWTTLKSIWTVLRSTEHRFHISLWLFSLVLRVFLSSCSGFLIRKKYLYCSGWQKAEES